MSNPVLAALAQARFRAAPAFARWCELNGASFCPAAPATIARFVRDCAALGIDRLWPAIEDISRLHVSLGLADPTLGGAAASAISEVANIAPPRSWPNGPKLRFKSLPYDVQLFLAEHEARRERSLRRAQNETAATKRKLSEAQSLSHPTEGMHAHEAGTRSDT